MQKKSVFIMFGLLLLWVSTALAEPRVLMSEPDLILDKTYTSGDTVTGVFKVYNDGNSSLSISHVSPSCGCIVASFDRDIAPGDEGRIILNVDTTGKKGSIYYSAIVRCNDPNRPKFMITMQFQVQP